MAAPRQVKSVKLFVAVLFAPDGDLQTVAGQVAAALGPIDSQAGPWAYSSSAYYQAEMGGPLQRLFWGLAGLVEPDVLPGLKHATNAIEDRHRRPAGAALGPPGGRTVNLDPGYVHEAKVVLATMKDYSHRLYLGRGVYGETTLHWRLGEGWQPWPWTYPDYRNGAYDEFLTDQRHRLRQLRMGHAPIAGPQPAAGPHPAAGPPHETLTP